MLRKATLPRSSPPALSRAAGRGTRRRWTRTTSGPPRTSHPAPPMLSMTGRSRTPMSMSSA
eukprot:6590618-Alexandrium_andersonii.AAC.1